jgi:phosphoribosyl 1,2-cyclic phosphate phosphodiesterase
MRVTILGCGGSMGVPMVGGNWGRCDPANPRNRRLRPSILVETGQTVVLVDTTPDLRQQLLDAGVTRLDAVLYTHAHADHLHGLDDLRPLTYKTHRPVPAYADAPTLAVLEKRFSYAVSTVTMDRGLYNPILAPQLIDGPLTIGDLEIGVFEQKHGNGTSLGLRFGGFGYSTDAVALDEMAFAALEGVEVWVVDATREEPHPSHAHLERTLEWIARLRPRRAYLTHMNHTMDYDRLRSILPAGVEPAYDGLVIEL